MEQFQEFIQSLGALKVTPISESYRKQFKIKGEFIYPPSKQFNQICQSFLEDEKLRSKRKWDNSFKLFFIWFLVKFYEKSEQTIIKPTAQDWLIFETLLKLDHRVLKSRWITLINPQMKSINWLPEEDDFLSDQMQLKHKHIWTQIAVQLYDKNPQGNIRTPKQIRERWMNYLNPELKKASWLLKEDLIILNNVIKVGKRWSQISQLLDGRTENQVKNRYKSLVHKICKDDECDEIDLIKQYVRKNQAMSETNKQGIIGRRGRHKKNATKCPRESKLEAKVQKQVKQNEQCMDINYIHYNNINQNNNQFNNQIKQEDNFQMPEDIKISTPLMLLHYLPSPGFGYVDYMQKGHTPDMEENQEQIPNSAIQLQNGYNYYKMNNQSPFMNLPSLLQSPFWQDQNQFMMQLTEEQQQLYFQQQLQQQQLQHQHIQQQQHQLQQQQQLQQLQSQPQSCQSVQTTPYLNPLFFRPQPQIQNKEKELDFLKVENPIQQFNRRRNINQHQY